MAIKSETKTIGEHTYRVTQLTAIKGRGLFVRLVKLMGPALAEAVGLGGQSIMAMGPRQLAPLLSGLVERFDEDTLKYFCETLGATTEVHGNGKTVRLEPNIFDIHFAGHIFEMFQWLTFALEVNFSDFLSVWTRTQGVDTGPPVVEASRSPLASTGTSGVS